MRIYYSITSLSLILICGISICYSDTLKKDKAYWHAVTIAATVEDLIRKTRQQYIRIVVQKLEVDGTGSAFHFNKKGYIPLPAQLIRSIANVRNKKTLYLPDYNFKLRSYWNINKKQGLQDSFEKNGWEYLLKQQKQHKKSGKSLRYLEWQPYIDIESTPKGDVVRYISADIASSLSCINCHNHLETTEKVVKYRKENGIEAFKEFELYELLGAISIRVKINKDLTNQ